MRKAGFVIAGILAGVAGLKLFGPGRISREGIWLLTGSVLAAMWTLVGTSKPRAWLVALALLHSVVLAAIALALGWRLP
jgi:hypothetical protein